MDTEKSFRCRREQYRLRRYRKTPEEAEREGTETKNICNVEDLQWQWSREDFKELEMYKLAHQLETLCE